MEPTRLVRKILLSTAPVRSTHHNFKQNTERKLQMAGHKASKVSTNNGSEQKESRKLCWVGLFRFSTGHIPTDVQSEPDSSPQLRCALLPFSVNSTPLPQYILKT